MNKNKIKLKKNRRNLIKTILGGLGAFVAWGGFRKMSGLDLTENTKQMPSLFVGHGSPMNLVENNEFTKAMNLLGQTYKPKAILSVSAHWLDNVSIIQNSDDQKIKYDFYGFPKQLFDLKYPVKGWSEESLSEVEALGVDHLNITNQWGLDHGTWAVLYHMYPKGDVPVIQLSIPKGRSLFEYFQIGQKLSALRKKGVMILGSGNIVHNLYQIDWEMEVEPASWAVEFDENIKNYIDNNDKDKILSIDTDQKDLFKMAHPTNEHFIPLAYVLGALIGTDKTSYPCSFMQNKSISMRSVLFS